MKKIIIVLLLMVTSFGAFSQIKKVAVISVYGNKMIDGSDFGTVNFVRTLAQDDAFNLSGIVTGLKDKIFNDFSKDFPFALLEEQKVIENQEYKNYVQLQRNNMNDYFYTTPPGYGFLYETNAQTTEMFRIFANDSIDAIMYVSVDYKLYKTAEIAGFGTARVYAYVNILMYDKEGKKIFALREYEQSNKNLKFAMGGTFLEAKEILPLCEQATNDALINMKAKLPKSLAKMNKKINN